MKKLFLLLTVLVLSLPSGLARAAFIPNQGLVKRVILSFQETYPDGQLWSAEAPYVWQGGLFEDGDGGMPFLLMVSDAAFGALPARVVKPVNYSALRPGDILRIKNDTYSVMILEKKEAYATVLEVWTDHRGESRVYWGRTLSKSTVEAGDYYITRYPK